MEDHKIKPEIFDATNENIEKLKALFPSAVKDGQLDIDALKQELGEFEETGKEKYELTWTGKSKAKQLAAMDITGKTLNFIPEDSKNPDSTDNLYIEGDNLEVLKLLRKSYYSKIKMIYIDPPYNTGNDFVYKDKFNMSEEESNIAEGIKSEEGDPLQPNPKSSNRYHANWLNMMYPRLKIARDLLTDDGVIFISIDDNEVANLKKICDEIFGEDNFVGNIVRISKTTSFRGNYLAPSKDYVLCYSKNLLCLQDFVDDIDSSQYSKIEETGTRKGEKYRDDIAFYLTTLETRPNQRYYIECPDGQKVLPPGSTFPPEKPIDGDGVWRWNVSSFVEKRDLIVFKKTSRSPLIDEKGNKANWNIYTKSYLKDKLEKGNIPRDICEGFLNRNGSEDLKNIKVPYSFPKPVDLIKHLIKISRIGDDSIILDFFSGSSTTAHAVMKMNQNGGNRRFIMVQWPEEVKEKENSEAYKFLNDTKKSNNLCEIGKERIRRAGEKIKQELIEKQSGKLNLEEDCIDPEKLDIGFKVFRVADTNIRWNSDPLAPRELIEGSISDKDHLDFMPGFKDIDIVYEILLRHRDIPLSSCIEKQSQIGDRTYCIANTIVVCLEEKITTEMVDLLAGLEPKPSKIIFRDSAFDDDISLKLNTLKRLDFQLKRFNQSKDQTYRVEFI
jgi:adenine-specific DNA-methyltransferase